jgi:hypothetical protein
MAKADLTPDDLEAVRTIVVALEKFQRPDQQRILRWAQEKLGIANIQASQASLPSGASAGGAGPAQPTTLPSNPSPATSATDIKSFIERKKPASDVQLTAAIAYYYSFEAPETARKTSLKSDDLIAAARAIGQGGRFKKPAQTLVNAHQQGLLDRSAAGGYVLSHVGENLVAVAMGAEGTSLAPRKNASRRRAGKKAVTKKARR